MKRILLVALSMLIAGAVQAAGDAAKGRQKAEQICGACHGVDGNKPSAPDQPILAGQYSDYLVQALSDYKSGRRSNAIMKAMAAPLSAQDMEDVAAWFSSRPTPLHDQR